jgi:hypothetical protein
MALISLVAAGREVLACGLPPEETRKGEQNGCRRGGRLVSISLMGALFEHRGLARLWSRLGSECSSIAITLMGDHHGPRECTW